MGPIELLMILGGLVVLYIIVKLLGRLFGGSRRKSYHRGNEFDNRGRDNARRAQENYDRMQKSNREVNRRTNETIKWMRSKNP